MPNHHERHDTTLEQRAHDLIRRTGHEPDPAAVLIAKDLLRQLDELVSDAVDHRAHQLGEQLPIYVQT